MFRLLTTIFHLFAFTAGAATATQLACPYGMANRAVTEAQALAAYYEAHLLREQIRTLGEYIAIRTVSAEPAYRDQMDTGARFTAQLLRDAGLGNVEIGRSRDRNNVPVIYGETPYIAGRPTFLLYGHFDVAGVSPDQLRLWLTDPFTMVQRGDLLYGRGGADNKAGVLTLLYALKTYRAMGRAFPINIRVLIEGGEEVGASLAAYVEAFLSRFAGVDALVLCDGVNRLPGRPVLEISTRGAFPLNLSVGRTVAATTPATPAAGNRFTIRIRSGDFALHSGSIAGGAVPNPLVELSRIVSQIPGIIIGNVRTNGAPGQAPSYAEVDVASTSLDITGLTFAAAGRRPVPRGERAVRHGLELLVTPAAEDRPPVIAGPQAQLLRIIASLFDREQRVAVPGFYDGMVIPSYPLDFDPAEQIFRGIAGLRPGVNLLPGPESPMFRVARLPAMNVGSIIIDENGAHAGFLVRTVPGMDPTRLARLFRFHVASMNEGSEFYASLESDTSRIAAPDRENLEAPYLLLAQNAMRRATGRDALLVEEGGTLPLLSLLRARFPHMTMLFHAVAESETAHMHGENEAVRISRIIEATRNNLFLFEAAAQGVVPLLP